MTFLLRSPFSVLRTDKYILVVLLVIGRIEEWAWRLHEPTPGLPRRVADEIKSID